MPKVSGTTNWSGVDWGWTVLVDGDTAELDECFVGNVQVDLSKIREALEEQILEDALRSEGAPRVRSDFAQHNVWNKAQMGTY